DAVPSAKLRRQGSPSDVVNRKIMQRFQELAIIAPLVPAARARRPKRLDHDLPIDIRHPCQHDRLPQADLLSITDAVRCESLPFYSQIPSTRPKLQHVLDKVNETLAASGYHTVGKRRLRVV